MFKSIVLATDGSDHAARAAAQAVDMAAAYKAKLTLVTVLPRSMTLEDLEGSPLVRKLPKSAKTEFARLHKLMMASAPERDLHSWVPALPSITNALAEVILDQAEKVATRRKVARISRVVEHGDAAEGILKAAKKAKADMIVLGTRGWGDFGRLALGSVSHKVIHQATCSCVIVR